jgi:hypothetical protein
MNDKMAKAFASILLLFGGIFIFTILGAFLGALAGWIVGLVLGDAILHVLDAFGAHNITMWQFGALMGFVGGFLRTKTEVTQSDE